MINLLIENSFLLACTFMMIALGIALVVSAFKQHSDDPISDGLKAKLALDSEDHDDQLKNLTYNQHVLNERLLIAERKAGVPDTPKLKMKIVRGDDKWVK